MGCFLCGARYFYDNMLKYHGRFYCILCYMSHIIRRKP